MKIIIGALIINLITLCYLKKEIENPKKYYLVDEDCDFISHIRGNGSLEYSYPYRTKWRLPDAKKAKKVYPNLKIIDCATLEELEE